MFMAIDNPPENAYENVGWINDMRRGGKREEWVHVQQCETEWRTTWMTFVARESWVRDAWKKINGNMRASARDVNPLLV